MTLSEAFVGGYVAMWAAHLQALHVCAHLRALLTAFAAAEMAVTGVFLDATC